jgi:exodeoxyribonuclease VII large subunit
VDEYHSVVQGENNADQLLQKLIEVYQSNVPYDAVVITRGGGAQTDFLIFDNYQIGRAVAKFPIPIITGIGHQKNETITDLMAHTQTKTPTKAAEFIVAHNKRFEDDIVSLQKTILIKSQQLLSWHIQALTKVSSQILSKPKITLYNRIKDIESKIDNLGTFTAMYLKNQHGNLGHFVSILKVMAPENILKKGFAIVKVNQKITSNPSDIGVGEDIEVILADTQITATVKNKTKYDGTDHDL